MKKCPNCGENFNLWQRLIGEDKEHSRRCHQKSRDYGEAMATGCRGCPAGCFENASDKEKTPEK
jgi:hypothetical protein